MTIRSESNIGLMRSLEELRREKFVPFIHTPLYTYGGIPVDKSAHRDPIINRFVQDTRVEVIATHFDFQGLGLITLPMPYNSRLFVMGDTTYPIFCKWLETIELLDRNARTFAIPRRVSAPIYDPFIQMLNAQAARPEIIDVWGVSSMTTQVVPATHTEALAYPIFRVGEAEDLDRAEFLKRLPRPTSAPAFIQLVKKPADPQVIVRGRARLGEVK